MQFDFGICSSVLALAACALPGGALAQTAPAQSAPAQSAPTPSPTPAPAKEGELVVTGVRAEVSSSPDRMSFNVANDLNVQAGTVADALRAVPGVEVDLQGGVSLRGDPGVTILIDGRPSAMMRGEGRGDALTSMPAGSIERVEVITNPSAAMSPEGSGGVINLVTKQAKKDTRSASVRANVGPHERGSLNLSGSWSHAPLTLSGDLGYRRFTGTGDAEQIRSRFDSGLGGFVTSRQDSEVDIKQSGRTGRFGLDYDLDKKNRLSTELSYRAFNVDVDRMDVLTGPTAASSYTRDSNQDVSNKGGSGRVSWRRTLPGNGHELVVDLELEKGRFEREVTGVTVSGNPATPAVYERIVNAGERGDYGFKVDYKRPMGTGETLNIGYEYDLSRNDFDFSGARGASTGALLPVASLTNVFDYDQAIHAWFATYQFSLGKLELQPGLRAEQVERVIDQVTDNIRVENDYFRVYPTLHIGYELSAKQKLRGSYSRRISRPGSQDLNPYTLYIDPQNLRRGNPNLLPEVTDSFEAAWQLRAGAAFYSITGFYRRARGGVTDVITDVGGGVFLSSRANLATAERVGVEAIANGKFSKTLSYNASATFLWNQIDTRQPGFVPQSGTTGTARVNLSWQPTPKDFFQLGGFFSGDQLIAQGYRASGGMVNLGYRRKINDRFSLLLTGQNILDTAKQTVFIETPTIRDRITQKGPGQILMIGLTYTLGGQGARRRPEPAFDFDQGGGVPQ